MKENILVWDKIFYKYFKANNGIVKNDKKKLLTLIHPGGGDKIDTTFFYKSIYSKNFQTNTPPNTHVKSGLFMSFKAKKKKI